ncbi:MAG: CotH kinase family protein [Clostridia bacterium]|nr:CotH kinase family protein [Clostridia bacterium]
MSTHKKIDIVCVAAVIIALVITAVFMNGELLGIAKAEATAGYEKRLFNTEKVHTLDIVIDDWDSFISSCVSEEYSVCDVIIDGEAFNNVAIRGKGNTSLSNVASMDSDRYSFKIEFDHFSSGNSYYGLDKLSLNNIIQDNTYMKDYLTYRLMGEFGVSAPLCSYVYITVGGEDWGLYLAVEGIEDAFLQRNYGNDYGELYKPDSMSFGGGRGNGKDFDINAFVSDESGEGVDDSISAQMPVRGERPQEFSPSESGDKMPQLPEDFDFSQMQGGKDFGLRGDKGGMGSDDVKLKYIDDNVSSYQNIFDNAKTDITSADKQRLIESLKSLSAYEDLENTVDIDKVLRYFTVHNYVCNGDSYTGSMIHNYYLYEKDGQLSMIPWDYNLAFGTFQSADAVSTVNSPIDTPVSGGNADDRPMVGWIFYYDSYKELYHKYFAEFINTADIQGIIASAKEIISPYVEKDPTKFCTYDEYLKGVEVLSEFCRLRSESVKGQLDGTIPPTSEGQSEDSSKLIDASDINISDMGTMGMGGGRGERPDMSDKTPDIKDETAAQEGTIQENTMQENTTQEDASQQPEEPSQGGMVPPQGEMPQNGMVPPQGEMPQDGSMPQPPEGMPQRGERPQPGFQT